LTNNLTRWARLFVDFVALLFLRAFAILPSECYYYHPITFASKRLLGSLRPTTVTSYLFGLKFIHFHDYSSSIKFEFPLQTVTPDIPDMTVTIPPNTLRRQG